MIKRAVILVPGFDQLEQSAARDRLARSILNYATGYKTAIRDTSDDSMSEIASLTAQNRETLEVVDLHILEAYWGDLVPDWSQESPWARFKRGLLLIWYWAAGGVARATARFEFPTRTVIAMVLASVALLFWYFTIISLLLDTLGGDDSALPAAVLDGLEYLGIGTKIGEGISWLQSWPVYVFVIGIFGLGRLESMANVSSFVKDLLRDQPQAGQDIGVRAKARARVTALLDRVSSDTAGYDEIHVVGHSLGGAIAVDALADYGKPLPRTTLHTWGAALGLLVQQDPWVERRIGTLYAATSPLGQWYDVVFRSDVMASPRPLPHRYVGSKRQSEKFDEIFEPTLTPQCSKRTPFAYSETHEAYYRCPTAMQLLVRPTPDTPLAENTAGDQPEQSTSVTSFPVSR